MSSLARAPVLPELQVARHGHDRSRTEKGAKPRPLPGSGQMACQDDMKEHDQRGDQEQRRGRGQQHLVGLFEAERDRDEQPGEAERRRERPHFQEHVEDAVALAAHDSAHRVNTP